MRELDRLEKKINAEESKNLTQAQNFELRLSQM
jgi:hypothetical protein